MAKTNSVTFLHTLTSTLLSSESETTVSAEGLTLSSHDLSLLPISVTTTTTTTTALGPIAPPSNISPPPDYLLHTRFVCDNVLVPLVVSFGIVGNLLSLVVLTRKEMASPTNCFLTALAISDISLLLLRLPMFFGLSAQVASTDSFKIFSRYYAVILFVMTNVFLTCTCWMTVAVTVERFLSLRFMMHPRLICSMVRAKRVILAIFFASFLFHFSKFFDYVPNTDLRNPQPLLPTELSLNKTYDAVMHIANITLAALLPIVALVIFNSFLIYFLATHRRRMLKNKSKGGGVGPGEGDGQGAGGRASCSGAGGGGGGGGVGTTSVDMLHVSTVVVGVVLVFVICHCLGVFLALNIAVHGRHVVFSNHLFVALKHVNSLLVTVNSSVNFLVYCSISRKFRTMFTTIFFKRCLVQAKTRPWSQPLPLSDSLPSGLNLRAGTGQRHHHHHNGYTPTSNDNMLGATKDASFLRPSPTNSLASRSVDQLQV